MQASPLEIQLLSLRCVQMSEKDGDEMYVNFEAHNALGRRFAGERVPARMDFWQMYNGSVTEPNHVLYVGEAEPGTTFTVTLMEMDILQVIKNALSIVGEWVDDFVGRVRLTVNSDGSISWDYGRFTEDQGMDAQGVHTLRLMGNNSEYFIRIKVHRH